MPLSSCFLQTEKKNKKWCKSRKKMTPFKTFVNECCIKSYQSEILNKKGVFHFEEHGHFFMLE